jgi:hypothetical protein
MLHLGNDADPFAVERGFLSVVLLVVRREIPAGKVLAQIQQGRKGFHRVLREAVASGQVCYLKPFEKQKVEFAP